MQVLVPIEELKIEFLLFGVDVEWNTKGGIVFGPCYVALDVQITNRERGANRLYSHLYVSLYRHRNKFGFREICQYCVRGAGMHLFVEKSRLYFVSDFVSEFTINDLKV